MFQAVDKQSAKWISSRAGFETHCNSAGEMSASSTRDTQHRRAGAGREMISPDIKGYFQAIRKQLVVLQSQQGL